MALDKETFKNDFVALMTDMRIRDVVSDTEFAQRLGDLLEAFVKSGEGRITESAMVAGTNAVTATSTVLVKIN